MIWLSVSKTCSVNVKRIPQQTGTVFFPHIIDIQTRLFHAKPGRHAGMPLYVATAGGIHSFDVLLPRLYTDFTSTKLSEADRGWSLS